MAAVHFTTIPHEPKRTNRHIERHIFGKFVPVLRTFCFPRFEVLRTFLYYLGPVAIYLARWIAFC